MTDRPDVIAPVATVPIGAAFGGATAWAFCMVFAIGVLSYWFAGHVWWDWVIVAAVVPYILVGLGAAGLVVRIIVSWNVRPKAEVQVVTSDTERVHIVGMNQRSLIDARPMPVDARDLEMFISQSLPVKDWTQKRWVNTLLPSGRRCDTRYHQAMMDVLTRSGVIIDYKGGSKGVLAIPDPADALRRCSIQTGLH